jgi:hypothetical protein
MQIEIDRQNSATESIDSGERVSQFGPRHPEFAPRHIGKLV